MKVFLERYLIHHRIVKPALFSIIIVCFTLFILFSGNTKRTDNIHRHDIDIIVNNDVVLKTQRTDSSKERTIGLSSHEYLDVDEAMLFEFSLPGLYGFHMPDMNFPIDIFWLNEKKEIVFIKEDADPSDFPEIYKPDTPALYVVETVAGFGRNNNLNIGNSFAW
jgi:uncharacterized membrane protein (UPF0127 family)